MMLDLLKAEKSDLTVVPLSGLVTASSLPRWKAVLDSADQGRQWRQRNNGIMPLVRHPAPNIAYVFCPLMHPDQTEPVVIERETQASADIFTLVYDDEIHDWKIHQFGAPASPQDLGEVPFRPA